MERGLLPGSLTRYLKEEGQSPKVEKTVRWLKNTLTPTMPTSALDESLRFAVAFARKADEPGETLFAKAVDDSSEQ